jgi:hypothetical protein
MTDEKTKQLWELLDELAKDKCKTLQGTSHGCCTTCDFYIDTQYNGECAISIVQDSI